MHSMRPVTNFLTFDIEEWYHANYPGAGLRETPRETSLDRLTGRLIDLCAEHGTKTTCFVLGAVAREKPQIVKKLHAAGHEIASHGYRHEAVSSMAPAQFADDVRISCEILQGLCGEKVLGYRAPSFSVTAEILPWFYDALEQAGLAYSSSIFPGRTFLYGIPDFPNRVHRPLVSGTQRKIVEFPVPAVAVLGKQLGLYIRLFPAWAIRKRIASDNRAGKPVVLYVHPREIDPDQPRLDLRFIHSVIHYWGIRGCETKVRTLLKYSRFGRIRDALLSFGGEY
jgi:polysaccharide deacetylase family protein (PEP-CTERM system associated)